MLNTITKIKEFKEGAKFYHCFKCEHNFIKPKNKKEIKCYYCGNTQDKVNTYVIK